MGLRLYTPHDEDAGERAGGWVQNTVWPVSLCYQHWVNVVLIFLLSCTGYYIMDPFFGPTASAGESTGYLMGWVRTIHFTAAFAWLLVGYRQTVALLEAGTPALRNAYPRAVSPDGNPAAQRVLADVFEVCDRQWRGIGMISASGWQLAPAWREYDASVRFDVEDVHTAEPAECHAGEVLQGLIKPPQCPSFGTTCTPRTPLGATMVSAEGACAAYYEFRRLTIPTKVN